MKLKMKRKVRENILGYSFISIWVVGFFIFTFIPIFKTLYYSFNKIIITATGIQTTWNGSVNYKNAFLSDVVFVDTLIQYVGEIILYVPIVIVFSLVIALILNRNMKTKGIFRTIFFLPVIIVSGPVMKEFIEQKVTSIQGVDQLRFIQHALENMPKVLATLLNTLIGTFVMILWFSGVQILIFLSALQKIDRPIYEAAWIDGASHWEAFWKITLPNLRTIISINIVYTIISISTFELNDVIVQIQKNSFNTATGLGYASALAWIYFVVLLLVIAIFVFIYGPKREEKQQVIRKGGRAR